jgi:hypothetical protein
MLLFVLIIGGGGGGGKFVCWDVDLLAFNWLLAIPTVCWLLFEVI